MTRKDYIMIAKTIKQHSIDNALDKDAIIKTLCIMFKQDNKRFDVSRFIKACD